jgi:hypothetical protein
MIDPAAIERIKDQIVEIVSARVQLRKTGANWSGLCPFHDDTKPSFTVSERKRRWHCFVCNEGGDAIDFIAKTNGTDFRGALAILGVQPDPVMKEHSNRAMSALAEIERDKNFLLEKLAKDEEHLQFFSRHINWLINAVPPLEREARWYSWERWLDAEFENIHSERERICEIARRHKKEVLEWTKNAK